MIYFAFAIPICVRRIATTVFDILEIDRKRERGGGGGGQDHDSCDAFATKYLYFLLKLSLKKAFEPLK